MSKDKCLGCGATKQTNDNTKVGFVKDLTHDYCLECFSLNHYGKVNNHFHPNTYDEIKSGSLVLIISSIIHLDQLYQLPITKIQPNAKYIYLINQTDLLPTGTNLDHIDNEIKRGFRKNQIAYDNIIYMSALNKADINNLKEFLINRKEKDIYLFGYQNSGKTTILKGLTNNKYALNINKAGLTQEVIIENLEDKTIYDLPGVYTKGYLADLLSYEEYGKLLLKKLIKPKIYQIKDTNKLVINDFLEIRIKGSVKESLVFYINPANKINKYNLKNENNYLTDKFEYVNKTFKVDGKNQITIADFIILFAKGNYSIEFKYPKNMRITNMESVFK